MKKQNVIPEDDNEADKHSNNSCLSSRGTFNIRLGRSCKSSDVWNEKKLKL